jgi:fibronectin-binding autotransporter adhesin
MYLTRTNRFLTMALAMTTCANAAPLTWDGNGNTLPNPGGGTGTWDVNSTLNWWDGAANVVWPALGGTDDDAVFGNTSGIVSLAAGGVTANDLTFNTTGYLIQNDILTLNGTTPTITAASGVNAVIGSVITGSAGLIKAGNGTLVLTGASTYSGITSISGGTLQLGNGLVNGTVNAGGYQIAAGTTLFLNNTTAVQALTGGWASQITGAGTLRLNSAQAVNGSGNWGPNATAATPFNAGFTGTLQVDNGRMDSSAAGLGGISNVVISNNAQFLAWTGTYNQPFSIAGDGWGEGGQPGALRIAGGNNGTFNGNITLLGDAGLNSQDAGAVMTIAGVIQGGFGIWKQNAGLLALTNANTYSGPTIINAGTLRLGSGGTTGSLATSSPITIVGGTLAFNRSDNISQGTQFSGAPITGAGALNQTGPGILTLNAANTYAGGTTIAGGTIQQGAANVLPVGRALTVNGTGVFDLNGFNASVSTVGGAATATVTDNAAGAGTSTLSITAAGTVPVALKDGATRTVALRVSNVNGNFLLNNAGNTFSGGLVLTANTRMSPGAITAGAYGTGTITVGEAATDSAGIYFGTATQTLANPIIANTALGTDRVGTVRVDVAGITLTGQLTANLAPLGFGSNGTGSLTATGQITGPNGLSLIGNPLGGTALTVTLNNAAGTNDYAGDTIINQNPQVAKTATLVLGAADQIPNGVGKGNVAVFTNGTGVGRLSLNGFSETINGLSGNGTVDGISGAPVLTVGDNNANGNFSGSLVNAAGSLALVKIGSGVQTLSGASSYTGGTTVSAGTLIAANSAALGTNSGLTVANQATFAYQPAAAGALNLGSGVLNLAGGSRIAPAVGGTLGQSAITSSSAAVTAGNITVDLNGTPGVAVTTGIHDLITAASGLDGASYSLGNVYNATNFTVNAGTLAASPTALSIGVTSATALAAEYWKGGLSGSPAVWAVSNGTTASNWASDAAGTATPLTPGAAASLIFSAAGATNQSAMTLGASMSVAGIVINNANPFGLNADGNTLTLGSGGLSVGSGAGAVTLGAPIAVGAAQNWTNNSATPITVTNTLTGASPVTIAAGTLRSGSTSAFGNGAAIALANAPGAILDVSSFNTTIGSIGGGGAAGGVINLGSTTLTVGGNNASTNFSGSISGAGGSLYKTGSGSTTLDGSAANTYTGTTIVDSGTLFAGKAAGAAAIIGPVTMGGGNWNQPNLRMLAHNQFGPGVVVSFANASGNWGRLDFMGTSQTLAGLSAGNALTQGGAVVQNRELNNGTSQRGNSTLTLDGAGTYLYNGYIRDADSGTSGTNQVSLVKSGPGTQTLVGNQITYSGPTTLSNGTLILQDTVTNPTTGTFASPITLSGSGVLNSVRTVTGFANRGRLFGTDAAVNVAGTGVININNAGLGVLGGWTIIGATNGLTMAGTININSGTFSRDNQSANNINTTATVNVAAGAAFGAGRGGNSTIGALNGAGDVGTFWSAASAGSLTVGNGGASGAFSGTLHGNGNGTDGSLEGGIFSLIKIGSGTQSLSGANTYRGTTSVNGGVLQLDFAAGGTDNILAPATPVVLGGGTLQLRGGSGETNSQTVNGVSGSGTLQLTQNGASGINFTVGAVGGGSINFTGSDATAGALGSLNYLTSSTTAGNNGTTRLGAHLWNGTDWASTSAAGGNHVVQWTGTHADIFNGSIPGSVVIPSGNPAAEVRILEATGGFTSNTLAASETINSLLMSAGTTAATLDMGANTLTVGNGAGAVGAVAIASNAQSLTIGNAPGQGTLTAGTSGASTLALSNQSSTSTMTVNSVIANNAGAGAVSLTTNGSVILDGANTYTGTTTVASGALQIGSGGTSGALGGGAVITNGSLVYNRSDAATWSNAISGTGSLVKKGADILTLTTASTYSGGTTISSGSVQWNIAGALGSGTITLNDSATGSSNTALVSPLSTGTTLANNIVVSNQGTGTVIIGSNGGTTPNFQTYSGVITLERDVILQGKSTDRTTFTGRITGTGNVTIDAAGTPDGRVTIDNNSNNFVGNVTVNPGALLQINGTSVIPDASNVTVDGKLYFNSAGEAINSFNGTGLVQIHPAVTFNPSTLVVGAANGSGIFSGVIQNGGTGTVSFGFSKAGTGTQILTGANLYTGATAVNGGILQVGNGGAAGQLGTGAVTIAPGATLNYNRTGLIVQAGGLNSTAPGAGTFNVNGDATTAVVLNAAGNFSGVFNVNAGALVAGATNPWNTALTAPVFNIASGAALAAGPASNHAHIGALNLSGGIVSTAPGGTGSYDGENFQLNGDVTVSGSVASIITRDVARTDANSGIALRGVRTFTVADVTSSAAVDLVISTELENTDAGTIAAAGVGGIIKTGPGTMSLAGFHSYSGVTSVNNGTLFLEAGSSIASSSLTTVSSGAMLSGSGIVGPITLEAGSALSPGSSPGILSTGSAVSAGNVTIEIGGPAPGNGTGFHDQINTSGILTLDGGLLNVSLVDSYLPAINDTFDIWLNDGTDAILGQASFTGLSEGSQISIPETSGGGLDSDYWTITYFGNTGNDIRLTYVPEPSSTLLAGTVVLLALGRRRRR